MTDSAESISSSEFTLEFEYFQLDNGLEVVLHQDNSDPIVALATIVHVGSNRERPGRTGFAHFFEHMSFNDSENVPFGSNRKLIEELGGTRNGGTNRDGTRYYEVVPKDAFDKLLWIDSDRLGYMINTVNEVALEREKQVVKNEKRQRSDNQPFGHTRSVISKALYPPGHPYSWTVIGELEDLQNATLDDVRDFYDSYYVPGNATLVIAGDIDIEETKQKINDWFGEIPSGATTTDPEPQPVTLSETKFLAHLDTFARVPEITITFPTVEQFHADSYALSALGDVLSVGKRAPLYNGIVTEEGLAPSVRAYQSSGEIAGEFSIRVRANENTDLNVVYRAIEESLSKFEQIGFDENELTKIKNSQTRRFYESVETVLDKAVQLGFYNEYAGDPGFISQDIANIKAVTVADVQRVYDTYIKDKPAVITSFVPKDQSELQINNSVASEVIEEEIVIGAETEVQSAAGFTYDKTPTVFDRSEPPLGEAIQFNSPSVWRGELANGIKVYGSQRDEIPLIQFRLSIEGGQLLDRAETRGSAVLLAGLLNEGTANRTPAELEDAIQLLGSRISFSADRGTLQVSGSTLKENYTATIELLEEMLLEPRWDTNEFDRLKSRRLNQIVQAKTNPMQVGMLALNRQLYGGDHISGQVLGGTEQTVANITMETLKDYYENSLSPAMTSFYIAGDIEQQSALDSLSSLASAWQGTAIEIPEFGEPPITDTPRIFFIDIPDAKQSVILYGKPTVDGFDPDYYLLNVAQNRLGGGSSARLFQTLRIEKGYTYGARTQLQRSQQIAPFIAQSQVRANVTLESLQIFEDLIGNYSATYEPIDLSTTKNLLSKNSARRYETLSNLLGMLNTIHTFELPDNYVELQQRQLQTLELPEARRLLDEHLALNNMTIVVVGDSATQLERVNSLGYGNAILLDRDGRIL